MQSLPSQKLSLSVDAVLGTMATLMAHSKQTMDQGMMHIGTEL